jgi:hypothetical protein
LFGVPPIVFQNLAPKIYKTILHQVSQTIYKSPNHFYIFFSLLYICIENPILLFVISMSFHLQIDGLGAQIFPRNWKLLESSFFNLAKKI